MRPSRISPLSGRTISQQALSDGQTIGSGTQANVDTSGGAVSILAPTTLYPSAEQAAFIVWDSGGNADANPITIDGNGRLIDGEASYVMEVAGGSVLFLYDQGTDQWRRALVPRSDPNAAQPFFLADDVPAPGGGGAPEYFQIDANDQLVYRFQDFESATIANLGALGSGMNMTIDAAGLNTVMKQGVPDGWFGKGLGFAMNTNSFCRALTPAHSPAWTAVTIATWFTPTRYVGAANFGRVFYKHANAGAWSPPWASMAQQYANSATVPTLYQSMQAGAAPTEYYANLDSAYALVYANRPQFFGMTFGGGQLIGYLNGRRVGAAAATVGALALGAGEWTIGATLSAGFVEHAGGILHECRVSNVVRSADWFQEVWLAGMGRG